MARPLDTESKAFGFLKVKNLYVVILSFVLCLAFIPILAGPFGIKAAFFISAGFLFIEIFYFAVSNNLPDNFIFNWIRYKAEPQIYFPGRETPERTEEK